MRAAVIPGVGQAWEVREVPAPRPGPGQVLIRVRASGVCHNDVLTWRGVLPFPMGDPAITGHEPVGEVAEVGPGVRDLKVGDRVGTTWVQAGCGECDYCALGLPVTGQTGLNCAAPVMTGFTVPGGHAEYVVAVAEATVPIPDTLPDELAAPMMCAGYTAWSALTAAAPQEGDRVAVLGIGGVGHLAVQFAKACGLETVAVTRSAHKHDLVRELGADAVVASGAELLAAGGADVVLVTGSSYAAATDCLPALRPNGRMVLAGIDTAGSFTIPPSLARPFFAQRQQVIGATHNGQHLLRTALDLAASGQVRPRVQTFAASEVATAVDRVARGEALFRAVVTF